MLKSLENYRLLPFVQYSKFFLLLSLLVILTGGFFAYRNYKELGSPLFLGIDFTGGSYIALRLAEPGNSHEIAEIAKKYSIGEPVVQVREGDPREVEIRINFDTGDAKGEEISKKRVELYEQMRNEIGAKFGGADKIEERSFDYVGPVVGKELIHNALWALLLGAIAIMFYIFVRFNRLVFAVAAVIALLHDIAITLTGTAIVRLEVNAFFIAIILTIIGYSINDTIIIYDRIRENLKNYPQLNFPTIINLSLTQTLTRSINTVLTTMFPLLAILVFGGRSLYDFSMAMLFGMVSGAYSSIFIAAPIVTLFSRERRKFRIPKSLNLLQVQEQAILGEWEEEEVEEVEEEKAEPKPAPSAEVLATSSQDSKKLSPEAEREAVAQKASPQKKKKKKKKKKPRRR